MLSENASISIKARKIKGFEKKSHTEMLAYPSTQTASN